MKSVGTLSVAQALHERICLLYLRLEGDPVNGLAVAEFDKKSGLGVDEKFDRETLFKQLLDAVHAYETVTGEEHPVGLEEGFETLGVN